MHFPHIVKILSFSGIPQIEQAWEIRGKSAWQDLQSEIFRHTFVLHSTQDEPIIGNIKSM